MKTFGLALGGGAARGLAHIGVIKYIEDNNIRINEVSGTSMGAIVAALYAMGKTSTEIENIALNIKYFSLIDFDLKNGIIKGNKIFNMLKEIFGSTLIEELEIPLKIVSTNIHNGKKVVFTEGSLVDAIRASISLPGVMKPHEYKGLSLIDGGIVNNLPIDVLDNNDIIAVTALKQMNEPLENKRKILGMEFDLGFFKMNYQILQRSIIFMMQQNENRSKNINKTIYVISPKFGDLDFMDFNKVKEFGNIGFLEAKKVLSNI